MSTNTLSITFETELENGVLNEAAALTSAQEVIQRVKAEREQDEETIKMAMDQVFDSHIGTSINMPYLCSATLQVLGIGQQPSNYKMLEKRVHGFATSNSQGKLLDKETGTYENPNSYLIVGRGKGSSVRRRSDVEAAEAAKLPQ